MNRMAEGLRIPLQDVIGDEAFAAALQQQPQPDAGEPIETPTIQVDAKGNILSDTSTIDAHILEQLRSPETQAQIAAMYRRSRYGDPEPPRGRYITESGSDAIDQIMGRATGHGVVRRDLTAHQIAPGRLGRRLQRQYLRKRTKLERASAKEKQHGRPDQPAAGDDRPGI